MFLALGSFAFALSLRSLPQSNREWLQDPEGWGSPATRSPSSERQDPARDSIARQDWLSVVGDEIDGERWLAAFLVDPQAPAPVGGQVECSRRRSEEALARGDVPGVLVHGTAGDAAETACLLARARFDQARWWYATGDAPPILTDVEYLARIAVRGGPMDRGSAERAHVDAAFYGNADTNAAWRRLENFGDFGIHVDARRGRLTTPFLRSNASSVFGFDRIERRCAEGGVTRILLLVDDGIEGARLGALLDPTSLTEARTCAVASRARLEASGLPKDPGAWLAASPR